MRMVKLILMVTSSIIICMACRQVQVSESFMPASFSGDFEFRNESDRTIWVDNVHGFTKDPACGILPPNIKTGLHLNAMSMPKQATIVWHYDNEKATRQADLNLQAFNQGYFSETLCFVFQKDFTWINRALKTN